MVHGGILLPRCKEIFSQLSWVFLSIHFPLLIIEVYFSNEEHHKQGWKLVLCLPTAGLVYHYGGAAMLKDGISRSSMTVTMNKVV